MKAGDQNPQQTEQAQDQQRVVQPQPAARINSHQNACSDEHLFGRKAPGQHKRVTGTAASVLLVLAVLVVEFAAGCLADPQRTQSRMLLDQLIAAHGEIGAQPLQADDACTLVGDVQSRLTGEPGLVDVRPAWSGLHGAAWALQAVCGQATLLRQPSTESLAARQARQNWELGIQRELRVACDHLREAAAALDRAAPC